MSKKTKGIKNSSKLTRNNEKLLIGKKEAILLSKATKIRRLRRTK